MMNRDYSALISASGKLKLKATALLGYGDRESRFEAAVLFHDAVRLEAQALALLPEPPPEVRLANAIERCACLVEGLDVGKATLVWEEVERLSQAVPREVAAALRGRLDPLYQAVQRSRAEARSNAPVLMAANFVWNDVPESARARVRDEIRAVLDLFPGDAMAHFVACMAALHDQRLDEAGPAIQRASRLDPAEPFFRGLAVMLLPVTTPATELEPQLAKIYEDLRRAPSDRMVYLGFMVASLGAFFSGMHPEVHRDRAIWAAEEGARRPSTIVGERRFSALGTWIKLIMDDPGVLEPILREGLRSLGVEDVEPPAPTRLMGAVISGVASVLSPPPRMPLAA